jgi:hypothetical protein
MTTVYDPLRRITTPVLACRSCGTPVYFGLTVGSKRAPFELGRAGEATRTLHFLNCPDSRRWTNRRVRSA